MSFRHLIAVSVAIATMLLALMPPLWIRATGDDVALKIAPVDPLSLFRGNYVDLRYDIDVHADDLTDRGLFAGSTQVDWNTPVYVVFDDARAAQVVRAELSRPELGAGETCVRGRIGAGGHVRFPELEQFFVTPERSRDLEQQLSDLVAVITTTDGCRAVLVDLEPA